MQSNPASRRGTDRPIEMVNWYDCQKFIQKLNGILQPVRYRLPTEAEWEYACRAGSPTLKIEGVDPPSIGIEQSQNEISLLGQKRQNAWGLVDMLGNMKEWCIDWKGSYSPTPAIDPQGPGDGNYKVIRGGAQSLKSYRVHPAYRWWYTPEFCDNDLSMRLVMVE